MHRFWGLTFGLVLLGALVLTAVAPAMGWWLPMSASTYAPDIDRLYYMILAVVTFFYVLTEALLVYNIWRFGGGGNKAEYTHGNQTLEIVWSIVPGVILVAIAVLQVRTWADIKYPTHLAQTIERGEPFLQIGVDARQWEYRVRYPSLARLDEWKSDPKAARLDFQRRLPARFDDVSVVNDVHVWKGQKVLLHLRTRDVGHSVFFPNLRLKQDALPGRTIPVWFEATESNTMFNPQSNTWLDGWKANGPNEWTQDPNYRFDLLCTQYCGTRHSLMRGKLYVHPDEADFRNWLAHAHKLDNEKNPGPAAVAANP
jgi:cytochrome c oxidase subunit 2